MGFFGSIIGAATKIVLTPVAVAVDVVKVVADKEPDTTKKLIESATDDIEEAFKL